MSNTSIPLEPIKTSFSAQIFSLLFALRLYIFFIPLIVLMALMFKKAIEKKSLKIYVIITFIYAIVAIAALLILELTRSCCVVIQ